MRVRGLTQTQPRVVSTNACSETLVRRFLSDHQRQIQQHICHQWTRSLFHCSINQGGGGGVHHWQSESSKIFYKYRFRNSSPYLNVVIVNLTNKRERREKEGVYTTHIQILFFQFDCSQCQVSGKTRERNETPTGFKPQSKDGDYV